MGCRITKARPPARRQPSFGSRRRSSERRPTESRPWRRIGRPVLTAKNGLPKPCVRLKVPIATCCTIACWIQDARRSTSIISLPRRPVSTSSIPRTGPARLPWSAIRSARPRPRVATGPRTRSWTSSGKPQPGWRPKHRLRCFLSSVSRARIHRCSANPSSFEGSSSFPLRASLTGCSVADESSIRQRAGTRRSGWQRPSLPRPSPPSYQSRRAAALSHHGPTVGRPRHDRRRLPSRSRAHAPGRGHWSA